MEIRTKPDILDPFLYRVVRLDVPDLPRPHIRLRLARLFSSALDQTKLLRYVWVALPWGIKWKRGVLGHLGECFTLEIHSENWLAQYSAGLRRL